MATLISGSTGVNKITDGTIVDADINASAAITGSKLVMPTGSVLQVVQSGTISTAATTSTSYVDSGLSLAITPSSTSSKIRVDVCLACTIRGNNSSLRGGIKILRGSTVIWNSAGTTETYQVRNSPSELNTLLSPIVLDSPSSTSAVTYKIQFAVNAGSSGTQTFTAYDQTYGTKLILTEIAG